MRIVGGRAEGQRLRALIVLLWRSGLGVSEALALQERDLAHIDFLNEQITLCSQTRSGKRSPLWSQPLSCYASPAFSGAPRRS